MKKNKERKQIKVSFGAAVSAVVITILVIVIVFLSRLLYQTNLNFEDELTARDNERAQMQTTITLLKAESMNSKEETMTNEESKEGALENLCHFNPEKGKVVSSDATSYILKQQIVEAVNVEVEENNKVKFYVSDYENNILNKYFQKNARKNGTPEEITGFDQKVDEAKIGILGQEMHEGIITFLMADGTVEYISLKDAVEKDKITTSGKIEGLENIVKIETATVGYGDGGNATMIAIDKAGNFYDLLEMVDI